MGGGKRSLWSSTWIVHCCHTVPIKCILFLARYQCDMLFVNKPSLCIVQPQILQFQSFPACYRHFWELVFPWKVCFWRLCCRCNTHRKTATYDLKITTLRFSVECLSVVANLRYALFVPRSRLSLCNSGMRRFFLIRLFRQLFLFFFCFFLLSCSGISLLVDIVMSKIFLDQGTVNQKSCFREYFFRKYPKTH